ncbi:hypothetical protein SAMN05216515_1545 [Eubacterium pyruvativorans]|uniref:Uncharacterized protein n=1 Tax=Eubacterium pyruvativorans TaxID=155865 RepID=A0A1I7IKH9_9FIRM|nr:hypothetical protein [Eubacterium pyruvativorans]SFO42500.1 hypothetical protein SAMN05216515_1545 [Eubacterium pyruvativorans]SFU73424.1 hypothetical protein SAMN05216508_1515 [Eubacterium pyruvativorans]
MEKKNSDSLTRFRELIERDNKRINTKKRETERKNLEDWFVYDCPAHEGPEKAKKFTDYGIRYGYDYSKLKNRIIDTVGLKEDITYRYCKNGNEMEALIDEIEELYSSRRKPIIFFSKGENGEMDSLYIRIRHSFAHGNFFKIKDYYYLWNETGKKGRTLKLGSFMALKYGDLKKIYNALATTKNN